MIPLLDGARIAQQAIDAVSIGSQYALVALGIALIFGIMRLINFAHGELIMIGGFALWKLANPPWPVLVIVPIVIAAVFAWGMERAAFRPVRSASPATLLVTSFALSYLLQNLSVLTFGAEQRGVLMPGLVTEQFFVGDVRIPKLNVITTVTTIVLLVALGLFLKKTALGVQMRAAAEDFRMSRLLGVRANRVIGTAFLISGALAGVVSILLISQTGGIASDIGLQPVLIGLVATVIGGIGSLPGAAVGGFILGGMTEILEITLPADLRPFRDAFLFGFVILVLLVRPQGLFAGRAAVARV